MRIGSLFSGAGGLDMAVEAVFGATTAWHCEYDSAASKVLAAHWMVPNLGDITRVDWDTVESPDILCGGYPCQPFSSAGQRKGHNDERHLWPYFAEAIRRLRPRYVVLENVAGHRTMGFDSVLGDLAALGFDAEWCSLRASDVGAPHGRDRVFVVAYPEHGAGYGQWAREESGQGDQDAADSTGIGAGAVQQSRRVGEPVQDGSTPTNSSEAGRGSGRGDAQLRGDCFWEKADKSGRSPAHTSAADLALLPTPQTNYTGTSEEAWRARRPAGNGQPREAVGDLQLAVCGHWGKYAAAIARWENLVGPAPAPTEPNKNGNPRLSAAFSEWLMGWPAGWVTDVPGISRNDQLRIIGNGVVPQQATAALSWLLEMEAVA